jgi:hypothetical protein
MICTIMYQQQKLKTVNSNKAWSLGNKYVNDFALAVCVINKLRDRLSFSYRCCLKHTKVITVGV